MNPAAMAEIAGMLPWHAKCLRENRARNRRARGSDSDVRDFRRARIVMSSVGVGSVADGAMVFFSLLPC